MKKILGIAMLIFCGSTGTVKAQTSISNLKQFSLAGNILAFNFIDNLSTFLFPSSYGEPVTKPTKATESEGQDAIEKIAASSVKYAMMMDVEIESLSNSTLYCFIDEWFGTRYHMGGTTKKGIDCSAFTSNLLLAVYALSIPRTARDQYYASERIDKEDLKEGDLVFFNTRGGISHVGVYLTKDYFVHASCSQGVTISNLDDSYYAKRYVGAGRM